MKLGLKIDVTTARGLRKGVPWLLECLARHQCRATFFFNVGIDRLFGQTWLPGPDLGSGHGETMRRIVATGHEAGLQGIDPAIWRARVAHADGAWTEQFMTRGITRFTEIFGKAPLAHAAPGWQMNRHALRMTQRLGFQYASDTRGSGPFIPVWDAEVVACPQLPTTLPTLAELAAEELAPEPALERLRKLSAAASSAGHVYTAHAELEGVKLASAFESLVAGWCEAGMEIMPLLEYAAGLDIARLPHHVVGPGPIGTGPGTFALQRAPFLG